MPDNIYIDTHSHFDLILEESSLSEDSLLEDLQQNNCKIAVQVSIDVENLRWSRDFALKHQKKGILFSAGIHPSSPAGKMSFFY